MKTRMRLLNSCGLVAAALVLVGCLLVTEASAQGTSGYNAVCYDRSGTASNCSTQKASPAFIDASIFPGGSDVCQQIRNAFGSLPATGGVIDARGVTPGSGNVFSCVNGTPWFDGVSQYFDKTPAEILLPGGQININQTWVIPNGTRLIGGVFGSHQNNGVPSTQSNGYGTSLRACQIGSCNLQAGQPIIKFGGSDYNPRPHDYCDVCNGISVEWLTVDGADGGSPSSNPQNLVGILNENAQSGSYVDHVNIVSIGNSGGPAIGLQIGAPSGNSNYNLAINSGPYTNIFFSGQGASTNKSTCVEIYQSGTLGLRGITCTAPYSNPSVAISLDASNTMIKDAHIEYYSDGVEIGAAQAAASDTLENISSAGTMNMTNIVHVCGPHVPSGGGLFPCLGSSNAVTDLNLIALANQVGSQHAANNIQDDVTATLVPATNSPYGTGLYAIGETFAGGTTRFSTSLGTTSTGSSTVPSWGVGDAPPMGTCPVGSIYSNTSGNGSTPLTLYVCYKVGSSSAWQGVM